MSENIPVVSQRVGWRKILIPLAFSLCISAYLVYANFKPSALASVHFTKHLLIGLFLGWLAVSLRDASFMYKLRLSVFNKLSWLKTFQIIIMWEFGAAITPKLGEVAFTLFVLKQSGLTYGRSVAAIMLNTFLDNLAFVLVFGILFLCLGNNIFFVSGNCPDLAGQAIMQGVRTLACKAWIGYVFFCGLAIFFALALFVLPHRTRRWFHWLASIKLMRRFKTTLEHLGDEIELTAGQYNHLPVSFWAKMTIATLINWASRYLLVNALVFAFSTGGHLNMLEVFARQYILWIFLIIPSTPGASGLAEISFIALNCEFFPPGLAAAIALIWRIYSYYLYLLLGTLVMPWWRATNPNTSNTNIINPKG